MRILVLAIWTAGLLLGSNTTVFAQLQSNLMGNSISIELSPQFPEPGEEVSASLNDFSVSTTGATIEWIFDGEMLPELNNQRSLTFTAPAVGETRLITARVTNQQGQVMQAQQRVVPLYLDVVVEPQTYSPPFYQGRTLPIHGSQVLLTALLQDSDGLVSEADYTYTWRLNNRVIDGAGVRGGWRQLITIPHGRNQQISVDVVNQQGTLVARRTILVPSAEVDIQLYENHPLYGLNQRAITSDYVVLSNSTNINAVPYNLANSAFQQNLFTEWRINNQRSAAGSNPFEITLRQQGSGMATLSFRLRNRTELLQGGERSVNVNF